VLHLAWTETGTKVLTCPLCERELLPAYEAEGGLVVAYSDDFAAGEGENGFLVCGDFDCSYEEPVQFTARLDDAVVISLSETLSHFELEHGCWCSAEEALQVAEELRAAFVKTGKAKLLPASDYYLEIADRRLARLERWVEAAGVEHWVTFSTEAGEYEGRIKSATDGEILVEARGGEIVRISKMEICEERIQYPRRTVGPPYERGRRFRFCFPEYFMVVEGTPLLYSDYGIDGRIAASTTDPEIAQAMGLVQMADDYYRGYFTPNEIERTYARHEQVLVKGRWVRKTGVSPDDQIFLVQSEDPRTAELLHLSPVFERVFMEFGSIEGDVLHYQGAVPVDAVEATSFHDEDGPLPIEPVADGQER